MLQKLSLSLQFGRFEQSSKHKAIMTRHWFSRCIRHALSSDAEITVRIVDLNEAQTINRDFRQKNYPTNVLTFNYEKSPSVLADLVLCGPIVEKEAIEQNKSLRDHYAHLLVHGTLHAQDWDHETSEKDALEMEAYEVEILAELGITNPY